MYSNHPSEHIVVELGSLMPQKSHDLDVDDPALCVKEGFLNLVEKRGKKGGKQTVAARPVFVTLNRNYLSLLGNKNVDSVINSFDLTTVLEPTPVDPDGCFVINLKAKDAEEPVLAAELCADDDATMNKWIDALKTYGTACDPTAETDLEVDVAEVKQQVLKREEKAAFEDDKQSIKASAKAATEEIQKETMAKVLQLEMKKNLALTQIKSKSDQSESAAAQATEKAAEAEKCLKEQEELQKEAEEVEIARQEEEAKLDEAKEEAEKELKAKEAEVEASIAKAQAEQQQEEEAQTAKLEEMKEQAIEKLAEDERDDMMMCVEPNLFTLKAPLPEKIANLYHLQNLDPPPGSDAPKTSKSAIDPELDPRVAGPRVAVICDEAYPGKRMPGGDNGAIVTLEASEVSECVLSKNFCTMCCEANIGCQKQLDRHTCISKCTDNMPKLPEAEPPASSGASGPEGGRWVWIPEANNAGSDKDGEKPPAETGAAKF